MQFTIPRYHIFASKIKNFVDYFSHFFLNLTSGRNERNSMSFNAKSVSPKQIRHHRNTSV